MGGSQSTPQPQPQAKPQPMKPQPQAKPQPMKPQPQAKPQPMKPQPMKPQIKTMQQVLAEQAEAANQAQIADYNIERQQENTANLAHKRMEAQGEVVPNNFFVDAVQFFNKYVLFEVSGKKTVPLKASDILMAARTSGSLQNFLAKYNLATKSSQGFNDTVNILRNPHYAPYEDLSEYDNYDEFMEIINTVKNTNYQILDLVANTLDEETTLDPTIMKSAKERYEASKSRYESIENKDNEVSYYEGWFPITRPLKVTSMYVLFGFSLLFMILAILVFLRMRGIELNVTFPTNEYSLYTPSTYVFSDVKKYLIGGATVGSIAAVIGIWRGWF